MITHREQIAWISIPKSPSSIIHLKTEPINSRFRLTSILTVRLVGFDSAQFHRGRQEFSSFNRVNLNTVGMVYERIGAKLILPVWQLGK